MVNPYQSPQSTPSPLQQFPRPGTCPSCGSTRFTKVGFTWWGGVLGPSILSHVKCDDCGTTFNSKSGKSNQTGIVIYSITLFVIVLALYAAIGTL